MARMWMVRGDGGRLYDAFRERGVAGIGWSGLAAQAIQGGTRKQLTALYQQLEPHAKPGRMNNIAMGQVFEDLIRRFNEVANETAGEHFTPREVIRLMVNLLHPHRRLVRLRWAG